MNKLEKIEAAIETLQNANTKRILKRLVDTCSLDLLQAYVMGATAYSCGDPDDDALSYLVEIL